MKIAKKDNQYYGNYFEEAVCSLINHEEIENKTHFNFSDKELEELNSDAKKLASYLNSSETAKRVGNHTKKDDCDILLGEEKLELKYTKNSTGTYYNTSISYFSDELKLDDYHVFLEKYGVLKFLEPYFGKAVYIRKSPAPTIAASSDFRKANPDIYKELKAIEKTARKKYIDYLKKEFLNDNSKIEKFVSDMLTKTTSGKTIPDRILIFDHESKEIKEISKKEITDMTNGNVHFTTTDSGFTFPNFRATLAWQNGTGLNNPTIRIFLNK